MREPFISSVFAFACPDNFLTREVGVGTFIIIGGLSGGIEDAIDAHHILSKRPPQLSQISEVAQGFHVPWVKVEELVGEVAVEVMTVSSGHPS